MKKQGGGRHKRGYTTRELKEYGNKNKLRHFGVEMCGRNLHVTGIVLKS
jgi:hypothetical protein